MNVNRWKGAWEFLLLDLVERFDIDLLVPNGFDLSRPRLREILRTSAEANLGLLNYRLFCSVDPKRTDLARNVFLWGEYIFIEEGPDRPAEKVWASVVYWIKNFEIKIEPPTLAEKLLKARDYQHNYTASLKRKIDSARSEPVSEWDAYWFSRTHLKKDAILEQILLISRFNGFLHAWHEYCSDLDNGELQEVFDLAVKVAQEQRMPLPVVFPGSWEIPVYSLLREG